MKKSDIKVGVEYYVNAHKDWEESAWGRKHVRVLDTTVQRWKHKPDGTWDSTYQSYGGYTSGILVEELNETGKVIWTGAVTTTSVRGEWKPTYEAVEARLAAKRKYVHDARQSQLLRQLETGKAVAMAKQMNIPGVKSDAYGNKVEVDPKVFMAMLRMLDSESWTYNPNAEEK